MRFVFALVSGLGFCALFLLLFLDWILRFVFALVSGLGFLARIRFCNRDLALLAGGKGFFASFFALLFINIKLE